MSKLLLIGGGGHCRSAIDVIEAGGRFSISGVVEAKRGGEDTVCGYPIVGVDSDLPKLLEGCSDALVTIGQIKTSSPRSIAFANLKSLGANLPVVAAPTSQVSARADLGEGTMVMHMAIVNSFARVGKNVIVNTRSLIEHEASIGDHCHIATSATINGNVTVGSHSFIGSGAVIKNGVKIGRGCIIGAGTYVSTDIPSYHMVRFSKEDSSVEVLPYGS